MLNNEDYSKSEIDEKIWNLAVATNAMVKGLLGAMGLGGAINKKVIPIKRKIFAERGYENLKVQIINALKKKKLVDGDIIVISEKIFAVSQNRLIPYSIIIKNDPKKMNSHEREKMARTLQSDYGFPITSVDLIMSDTYMASDGVLKATLGVYNPNKIAYELAKLIKEKFNKNVDVIISDTDTGADVCQTLIGCISIGATPLGATKGLCIYQCMRATLSSEFIRGSDKGIPIVICRPTKRQTYRENIGEYRGYDGRIDYLKEEGIAFENSCK